MTNVKGDTLQFGVNGLKGNTPKSLKAIYRGLMGVTAIWAIVQPQFPEIPEVAVSVINRLCLIGGPVFYAFCQMFGWTKPE